MDESTCLWVLLHSIVINTNRNIFTNYYVNVIQHNSITIIKTVQLLGIFYSPIHNFEYSFCEILFYLWYRLFIYLLSNALVLMLEAVVVETRRYIDRWDLTECISVWVRSQHFSGIRYTTIESVRTHIFIGMRCRILYTWHWW